MYNMNLFDLIFSVRLSVFFGYESISVSHDISLIICFLVRLGCLLVYCFISVGSFVGLEVSS